MRSMVNDGRGDTLNGSTSRYYCFVGGGHSAFTSSAAVPSGARRSALLVFGKDQQFPSLLLYSILLGLVLDSWDATFWVGYSKATQII